MAAGTPPRSRLGISRATNAPSAHRVRAAQARVTQISLLRFSCSPERTGAGHAAVPASGSAQVDEPAMTSTSGLGTGQCRRRLDVEVEQVLLRAAAARGLQAPRRNR